jgi:hypothetical protein
VRRDADVIADALLRAGSLGNALWEAQSPRDRPAHRAALALHLVDEGSGPSWDEMAERAGCALPPPSAPGDTGWTLEVEATLYWPEASGAVPPLGTGGRLVGGEME